jgi:hypothetical protein
MNGNADLFAPSIQPHSDIQQPVQRLGAFRQLVQIPILQRFRERVE